MYLEIELADVTGTYQTMKKLVNLKEKVSSFASQLNVTNYQNNWIMVEGKTYLVRVHLFDKDRNSILLTKNLEFTHSFDKNFFKIIDQNSIGSELLIKVATHSH